AGDYEDVAPAQFGDCGWDRGAPVADLDGLWRRGEDRAANLRRRLAARIVVGDVGEVGKLGGDAAHQRTLAAIAVAAGPEDDEEAAVGVRAQRAEHASQRVR